MRNAALVPAVTVALGLSSDLSSAARTAPQQVHFQATGTGAPEAVLELDPDRLGLALGGCRADGAVRRLSLRLYVSGDAPPDDLDSLRRQESDALAMPLCIGETCRPLVWRIAEDASGDAYTAVVRLVPRSKPSSLRVVVPGEARTYAWHGDLAAVLGRICRAR